MVLRNLLAGLLLVSAVSAAQFTLEESLEKVKTLAGLNEETMDRAGACAERAVRHEMAHVRPAARELGLVVDREMARSGYAEAEKTMEGIWKAYGH